MASILINQKHIGLYSALLAAGVEFAVVGGVAVNVHGFTRATFDLDIFIRPTVSNAEATYRALHAIDAPLTGFDATDLLSDERHYRFGDRGQHIDILASIGEMSFDEVWRDRVEIDIAGLRVPFISKVCLLENKRQVGRLRDLADVEELEQIPDE